MCVIFKKKQRFSNPYLQGQNPSFKQVALWLMGYYKEPQLYPEAARSFDYPNAREGVDVSQPCVRWLNHSTFHLTTPQVSILTDPIWSRRCSPIRWLGPKRAHAPPCTMESLGYVDIVLISHNHYDHLDIETIVHLHHCYPNIQWYVPTGVGALLYKKGLQQVRELQWWEKVECHIHGEAVSITCVPSQHSSGRGLFDQKETLWGSFVVEIATKRFYFVGDTGYNTRTFKEIGEQFKSMDLSLIPIGAYQPRQLMQSVHVDPLEAVRIHEEVRSQLSIGMHWNTFKLTDEPRDQPPYDLYHALKKQCIDPAHFRVLDLGQVINW